MTRQRTATGTCTVALSSSNQRCDFDKLSWHADVTQASALRVSSTQLQAQIDELRQSRDALQHDLQRAEKKLDRQRMTFDKEREEWRSTREESAVTSKPVANGSGHSTPNASASEQEVKPPVLPPAEPFISPEAAQQSAELEHLAQSRLQQLEALQAETAGLHQELDKLKLSAHHPSELALRDSPFFQVYLQQLAAHASRADALQGRFEMAEQKLDQLRDSNLEFREAVLVSEQSADPTDHHRQRLAPRSKLYDSR